MSKLTEQLTRLLMVPSPQLEALAARRAALTGRLAEERRAAAESTPAPNEIVPVAPPQVAVISCMLPTATPLPVGLADAPVASVELGVDVDATAFLAPGFVAACALPFEPGVAAADPGASSLPWPAPTRGHDEASTTATAVECLPGDALPFAPPPAEAAAPHNRELSLEQYAMFCAELGGAAEARIAPEKIFGKYRFDGRSEVTEAHQRWSARFTAAPALRERWLLLRDEYARSVRHHASVAPPPSPSPASTIHDRSHPCRST